MDAFGKKVVDSVEVCSVLTDFCAVMSGGIANGKNKLAL